jgi:hypothetical protein
MDHISSHLAVHTQRTDLETINPDLLIIPDGYPLDWLSGTNFRTDQELDVHRHTARSRSDGISQLGDEATHLLDCSVPNVSNPGKCALTINQCD